MNNKNIIKGLIIALVVSLMVAGVYAAQADAHADTHTTNNTDGIYVSGSGDVAHISGYTPEIGCYLPASPDALNG